MWRDGSTVERTAKGEVILALAPEDGVHGVVREVQNLLTAKPERPHMQAMRFEVVHRKV